MTLKGKKNHCNVKLLRGYGVSINLKDNKVILTNGQNDITGKSDKEELFGRTRTSLMKHLRAEYGKDVSDRALRRINKRRTEGYFKN